MNRKFIIGGILFWAGLSGYMGLRILESYTEDAVFAALSAVPAQAEEIKFSFIDGTLSLKGVEYEIPDDRVQRKGTIESVDVKGFNRKIIFVKPDMPAYDPDTLPLVADSVELTGIRDVMHRGRDRMEREISSIEIAGWHQRLGLLLDRYHRDGVGSSFYEELFRCSMDRFLVEGVDVKFATPALAGGKADFRFGRIEAAGGIQPPRGEEKMHPVTVAVENIGFSSGDVRGTIEKVELKDLTAPSPSSMEKLIELGRRISDDDAADDAAVTFGETFTSAYEGVRKPFSAVHVHGVHVKAGDRDAKPVLLDDFTFSLSGREGESRAGVELSGLRLNAGHFGLSEAVFPGDFRINLKSSTRCTESEAETALDFGVDGLGALNAGLVVTGDMGKLRDSLAFGDLNGFMSSDIFGYSLKSASFGYRDSGLAAALINAGALLMDEPAAKLLGELKEMAAGLERGNDPLYVKLGNILSEQLDRPGEVRASCVPKKPVSGQMLAMQLILRPSALPIEISSVPGAKSLSDMLN